jgi:hypothetical protein
VFANSASAIDAVSVRVKIGWFTHDQTLPLTDAFALSGVAQPNCADSP